MINLLPQTEKKKLQKEFYLRYGVVVLVTLFILEVVSFLLFIPSYVALSNSTKTLEANLVAMTSAALPGGDATQNDLNVIKSEISVLKESSAVDMSPSQLMSVVLGKKPAGVVVSRFAYAHIDTGLSVQLSGNAQKPEDLILFRKLIKDDKDRVKDARYAQSFINKKSDIDFLLTVDFK